MAMNMNKLTEKAQEAIVAAQRLAEDRHHTQLEPEHLLYALVEQEDGVVPAILERLEIQPRTVLEGLEPALTGFARGSGPTQVQASNRFRRVFEAAGREAERLKDDYVSTEHFLLALADDSETGAAGQTLRRLGVTRDRLYEGLQAIRGGQRVTSATPETTYQSLEKYGRDLTALARAGQARSGHRPRRRGPARDPGPEPPDQEQPGAHRRARRRQDRDRRRTGPADRARRRARRT